MSETRILLASLLKPVTDTRMYEKLGLSLSKIDGAQVHIAGFQAPLPSDYPSNIVFHPHFNFRRLSVGRAMAQMAYWKLLNSIRPSLIMVCTHELLLVSMLYKQLNNCRLIYDVQENYGLNLLSQQNYATGLKQFLAGGVKAVEKLAARVTDHFLLAERSYADELTFLNDRYTIIENKYKPHDQYTPPTTPVTINKQQLKLLYTGTIAQLYGIFEAVDLADKLYTINPAVRLTIVGYCANKQTLFKLQKAIAGKEYISLIGGAEMVPHQQIIDHIKTNDVGLMPYHLNESIQNCIPTKLYEYVALGLPIIIQQNPLWDGMVQAFDAGMSINYKALSINNLLPTLLNNSFYKEGTPKSVFWDTEEQKLMSVVADILR